MIFLKEDVFLFPWGFSENEYGDIVGYQVSCNPAKQTSDPYLSEQDLFNYSENIVRNSNREGEKIENIFAAIERVLVHERAKKILILKMSWQDSFKFLKNFYRKVFFNVSEESCEIFAYLELRRRFYLNYQIESCLGDLQLFFDRLDSTYLNKMSAKQLVGNALVCPLIPLDQLGFDFQFINFLLEPRSHRSQVFAARALHIVKKQLIKDFVEEVVLVLIKNHFRIRQIKNGKISLYSSSDENIEWDLQLKIMNQDLPIWLADPMFNEDNIDYVWSTYDLKDLVDVRDSLLTLTEMAEGEVYHGISSSLFIQKLKFEDIVRFELNFDVTRILFNRFQYDIQINSYIVDMVLNYKRISRDLII